MKSRPAHNSTRIGDCPSPGKNIDQRLTWSLCCLEVAAHVKFIILRSRSTRSQNASRSAFDRYDNRLVLLICKLNPLTSLDTSTLNGLLLTTWPLNPSASGSHPKGVDAFQPSSGYQPAPPGVTYALLVIFARASTVWRSVKSGTVTSTSDHSSEGSVRSGASQYSGNDVLNPLVLSAWTR